MSEVLQQIAALIAFAAILVWINIKSQSTVMSLLTFVALLGTLGLAGYLLVNWVLL